MKGVCDHCNALAELTPVGHGIEYCPACVERERQMLAANGSAAAAGKFSNQHRARRNGYPGERRGPLSNDDKARVCILAREAFVKMHGRAPVTEAELQDWRREQQRKACGFGSLTHCLQEHMPALEAHFLDLKGESGQAFKKLMKPEVGDPRVALAILRKNLAEFGLHEGYAVTICRSKHKCELEKATAKQVWQVVYQIRKNQQRKARRGKAVR